MMNLSFKLLKEMHKYLGGNKNGYFITSYGNDVETGKSVLIEQKVAKFVRKNASADIYLVKGRLYK